MLHATHFSGQLARGVRRGLNLTAHCLGDDVVAVLSVLLTASLRRHGGTRGRLGGFRRRRTKHCSQRGHLGWFWRRRTKHRPQRGHLGAAGDYVVTVLGILLAAALVRGRLNGAALSAPHIFRTLFGVLVKVRPALQEALQSLATACSCSSTLRILLGIPRPLNGTDFTHSCTEALSGSLGGGCAFSHHLPVHLIWRLICSLWSRIGQRLLVVRICLHSQRRRSARRVRWSLWSRRLGSRRLGHLSGVLFAVEGELINAHFTSIAERLAEIRHAALGLLHDLAAILHDLHRLGTHAGHWHTWLVIHCALHNSRLTNIRQTSVSHPALHAVRPIIRHCPITGHATVSLLHCTTDLERRDWAAVGRLLLSRSEVFRRGNSLGVLEERGTKG